LYCSYGALISPVLPVNVAILYIPRGFSYCAFTADGSKFSAVVMSNMFSIFIDFSIDCALFGDIYDR